MEQADIVLQQEPQQVSSNLKPEEKVVFAIFTRLPINLDGVFDERAWSEASPATDFIQLWQDHRVKPLIDIRSTWKDKETRLIDDTRADNIVYDEAGQIYCHCPLTEERREMA